ncbi:unnamed protein product [Didymodactylos carnosus]|uniref:Uncharacterized protein n=1 Tax=Didymodactylos carnosus TaxID=1234261 RepID=A0A814RYN8_9BILA|nr:unnamed protein product [Didymodactylos carnosus]CAF1140496.1 unnamed protein product [Didymodactylos carnosus]CAF3685945.1 unnamed protein product [Didymodactylos carnosus]CAF3904186.1 unnamed protein product [Didymodactylos carnosus]
MNEDIFLPEWIDHNLNVLGFKNICLINVGTPISINITSKYDLAYMISNHSDQNFNLCRTCFNKTIRNNDLLFVQDVDQYLNVQNNDYIYKNYDQYDGFYFSDLRFGYIKEKTEEFSLLSTNVYRRPSDGLNEYDSTGLRQLFNCSVRGGWNACDHGSGKTMIKYGVIQNLGVHYHETIKKTNKFLHVDMKQIRLNHYYVRSKEDGILKGNKWRKLESMLGIIDKNKFFTMIYDDSILRSKRLI